MLKNKLILAVVILLIIIAVVVYVLSNRSFKQTKTVTQDRDITRVESINEKVYYPQYSAKQNAVYFLGDQGVILKRFNLTDQTVNVLYNREILFAKDLQVNDAGTKILIFFFENEKTFYKILDLETGNLDEINVNMLDAQWLDDETIIFSNEENNKSLLNKYQITNHQVQIITDLEILAPILSISPDKNSVVIFQEPEGYGKNVLYYYSLKENRMEKIDKAILVDGLWSPDSQTFVSEEYQSNGNTKGLSISKPPKFNSSNLTLATSLNTTVWKDNENLIVGLLSNQNKSEIYTVNLKSRKYTKINASYQNSQNNIPEIQKIFYIQNDTFFLLIDDYLYEMSM